MNKQLTLVPNTRCITAKWESYYSPGIWFIGMALSISDLALT